MRNLNGRGIAEYLNQCTRAKDKVQICTRPARLKGEEDAQVEYREAQICTRLAQLKGEEDAQVAYRKARNGRTLG